LDLLKRSLLGLTLEDKPFVTFGEQLDFTPKKFDPELRREGKDWPSQALSMIGEKRMDNLRRCVEGVIADRVPGDLIETGVWRGGATIFMRGVLAAHGVTDRTVWVADSFEGLPPPNAEKYPADAGLNLHLFNSYAPTEQQVRHNFECYGLLDGQVRFLRGFFSESLPKAPIERLAVLRLDGDLYESTIDALGNLYDKLSPGGYLIVDDYNIPACVQAVTDFRAAQGIAAPIEAIDDCGVFWRKGQAGAGR
jgi:O-methyltransferase